MKKNNNNLVNVKRVVSFLIAFCLVLSIAPKLIIASATDPLKQTFTFKSITGAALPMDSATLAVDGWALNPAKTAAVSLTNGYGKRNGSVLQSVTPTVDEVINADLAIDFRVNTAGNFALALQGVKYFVANSLYSGVMASIFIDDTYVGWYDFSGTAGSPETAYTQALNSMALTEGVHTLVIRRVSTGAGGFMRVRDFTITPLSALPTVSEVSVSGVPAQMYIGASATAATTVTMSDDSIYRFGKNYNKQVDANNKLEFTSTNQSAATVTNAGQIAAVGSGSTVIRAAATVCGIGTQSQDIPVVVSEPLLLGSAALGLGSTTISVAGTTTAQVTGALMNDGETPATGYTLGSYSSSAPAIATVNASTGVVTGVAPGTAKISVPVTLGSVTVSAEANITVKQTYTFKSITGAALSLDSATLAVDGWALNTVKTAAASQTNAYGKRNGSVLQFVTTVVDEVVNADLAIDFNVNMAGNFALALQGIKYTVTGSLYSGVLASIFIDDTYVGRYDFSGPVGSPETAYTQALNSMALTEGVHTLVIRRVSTGAGGFMRVRDFTITPLSALPTVSEVSVSDVPAQMYVGASATAAATVTMSDDSIYKLGENYNKQVDANNKLEFTSTNQSAATVTNAGQIAAVGSGSTLIRATATVYGIGTQSQDIPVVVSVPLLLGSAELGLGSTTISVAGTTTAQVTGALMSNGETPATGYTLGSYSSSSPAIASVDASTGTVTGVAPGTAKISVPVTLGSVTVSAEANITVTAVEQSMAGEAGIVISAKHVDTAAAITATVNNAAHSNLNSSVAMGSVVRLTAAEQVGDQGFCYWKDASGRVVGVENTFTFRMGTNTEIQAIYRPAPSQDSVLVEFIDKNGKVLQSGVLKKNVDKIVAPQADPFSLGYTFDRWDPNFVPNTLATTNATYIAQYTPDPVKYLVSVTGGSGGGEFSYNTKVTLTADAGEDTFAYWTKNGRIVSYDRVYSFYVWGETAVTAVTKAAGDTIVKLPSIEMYTPKSIGSRVVFCAERTVPEGYTLIEAGILLVTGAGEITLDTAGVTKTISRSKEPGGQFTVWTNDITGTKRARAYLIYQSGATYKVIYSNTVGGEG